MKLKKLTLRSYCKNEARDALEKNDRSLETLMRIEEIKISIKTYQDQIAYFQAMAEGQIDLRNHGCTNEIRRYKPTQEDKKRLPHTIENLRQQIRIFSHEQEALTIYGR
jgi:hypothetical protein